VALAAYWRVGGFGGLLAGLAGLAAYWRLLV